MGATVLMNKNESKYFHTAALFDEALICLLGEKNIEYISVKEICHKAGVNRSTFYLHYETIEDLLDECMEYVNDKFIKHFNEESADFIKKISESSFDELYLIKGTYLTPYLSFIKENKNIFKTSLANPESMKTNERFNSLNKYVINPIMDRFEIPIEKRKYILTFYIHGIMAIINEWIKNDCDDQIEKIQNIIIECIKVYKE